MAVSLWLHLNLQLCNIKNFIELATSPY